jgi:hypothetical protein
LYIARSSRPIALMTYGPSVGAGLFSLLSLIERGFSPCRLARFKA